MLLGMTALFFMDGTWIGALAGIAVSASVFFLEIWIDNGFARMRWQTAIRSGWAAALVLGLGNLAALMVIS